MLVFIQRETHLAASETASLKCRSTHQSRVNKSKRALASSDALLVDESQNGTPEGRRERGSANCIVLSTVDNELILSYSRHVRITPAAVVVDLVDVCYVVKGAIHNDLVVRAKRQRSLYLVKVRLDSVLLIVGNRVDIAEASTTGELSGGNLFKYLPRDWRRTRVRPPQLSAADGENVWACLGEGRSEDGPYCWFLIRANAAQIRRNAGVARGDDNGSSLQAELQILVALAVLVVVGKEILDGAV